MLAMLATPLAAPSPARPTLDLAKKQVTGGNDSDLALAPTEQELLSTLGPQAAYPPAWATANPAIKLTTADNCSEPAPVGVDSETAPPNPSGKGTHGFRNTPARRGSTPTHAAATAGGKIRMTVARDVLPIPAGRITQHNQPGSSQPALAPPVPAGIEPNIGEWGAVSSRPSGTAKESQNARATAGDESADIAVQAGESNSSLAASPNPGASSSAPSPAAPSAMEERTDVGSQGIAPGPVAGRTVRQATASDSAVQASNFVAENPRLAIKVVTPGPGIAPVGPASTAQYIASKTTKPADPVLDALLEATRPANSSLAASSTQGASPIGSWHYPTNPAPAAEITSNTRAQSVAPAPAAAGNVRGTTASGITRAVSNFVARNWTLVAEDRSGSAIAPSAAPSIAQKTPSQAEPLPDALAGIATRVDSSLAASPLESAPQIASSHFEINSASVPEMAGNTGALPIAPAPVATGVVRGTTASSTARASNFVASNWTLAVDDGSGSAIAASAAPKVALWTPNGAEPLPDALAGTATHVNSSMAALPAESAPPPASSHYETNSAPVPEMVGNSGTPPTAPAPVATGAVKETTASGVTTAVSDFVADQRTLATAFITSGHAMAPMESASAMPGIAPTMTEQAAPLLDALAANRPGLTASPRQSAPPMASSPNETKSGSASDTGVRRLAPEPVATGAVRETTASAITMAVSNFVASNWRSATAFASRPATAAPEPASPAAASGRERPDPADKPLEEGQGGQRMGLNFNSQSPAATSSSEPSLANSSLSADVANSGLAADTGSQSIPPPLAIPTAPPGPLTPVRPVKNESVVRPAG